MHQEHRLEQLDEVVDRVLDQFAKYEQLGLGWKSRWIV